MLTFENMHLEAYRHEKGEGMVSLHARDLRLRCRP
jgi:hypothetical protein